MINSNEPSHKQSSMIWMPLTVEHAVEQKNQLGSDARYMSGTTLLQMQWESGQRIPKHLISLEQISSLKEVKLLNNGDILAIGALTTLAKCRQHPMLKDSHSIICEAVKQIAAPAVRNRGTVGGNIMGGIGDLIPLFLTLEAELLFLHTFGEEKVEMWNWIKQDKDKQSGLLKEILIRNESPSTNKAVFFRKIGRRETFTAAIVTVSGSISWTESGLIEHVKLAIGGGENKPVVLEQAEQLIRGKSIDAIDWRAVYVAIGEEFVPVSDAFITADYRKKVAANLIIAELQSRLSSYNAREGRLDEIQ